MFSRDVSIAILCGGASRRFRGNKLAALLHGKPILQHTLDAARACDAPVALVGKEAPTFLSSYDTFVKDQLGDSPLAGVHAALAWSSTSQVIVIAGDMPLVTVRMLSVLSVWPEETLVVGVERAGMLHPLFARYHRRLVSTAESLFWSGERSAKSLAAAVGCSLIPSSALGNEDEVQLAIEGVNTRERLAIVEAYLERKPR